MTKQQYVLAGMMLDPEICNYCVDNLTTADFPAGPERDIFSAAKDIIFDGQALDYTSLDVHLSTQYATDDDSKGKVAKTTNLLTTWIAMITNNIIDNPHDWKSYARDLINERNNRDLWRSIDAAKNSDNPTAAIQQAIDKANKRKAATTQVQDTDSADDVIKIMQDYYSRGGIDTGFRGLDDLLHGGWEQGRLYVLGARPAVGKSCLMLQSALHAATRGNVVIYFSYEMGRAELYQRIISTCYGIPGQEIAYKLTPEITKVFDNLKGKLYIYDKADLDVDGIINYTKAIKDKTSAKNLMVFVDYLQIVPETEGHKSRMRYEVVGEISQKLKRLCLNAQISVIAAAQLSRQTVAREEPILSDLKESGSIEQDADCVMLLSRDGEKAKIQVAKNRSGACGTVNLTFEPSLTRFYDNTY